MPLDSAGLSVQSRVARGLGPRISGALEAHEHPVTSRVVPSHAGAAVSSLIPAAAPFSIREAPVEQPPQPPARLIAVEVPITGVQLGPPRPVLPEAEDPEVGVTTTDPEEAW